jgi:FtsZ-binding cell division protein ZapB
VSPTIEELVVESESLRQRIAELENESADLQNENTDLQNENDRLSKELNASLALHTELQKTLYSIIETAKYQLT